MDSLVCEFVECLMTYLSDTLPDFVQFDIQNCDTKYPNLIISFDNYELTICLENYITSYKEDTSQLVNILTEVRDEIHASQFTYLDFRRSLSHDEILFN